MKLNSLMSAAPHVAKRRRNLKVSDTVDTACCLSFEFVCIRGDVGCKAQGIGEMRRRCCHCLAGPSSFVYLVCGVQVN